MPISIKLKTDNMMIELREDSTMTIGTLRPEPGSVHGSEDPQVRWHDAILTAEQADLAIRFLLSNWSVPDADS